MAAAGSARQDRDHGRGFLDALQPAAVLGQCDARSFDLSGSRLAAQLCDQFMNLAQARRTDRMALDSNPPMG